MFSHTNAASIQAILHASVANSDNDGVSTLLREYLESLEKSIVESLQSASSQTTEA